jgi:Icc-related predicted phosphoesterase
MKVRQKLFFATDIHGSDVCFRKFLNAAKVYGASALILGGDITGKGIVPLIRQRGTRIIARWNAGEVIAEDEAALAKLEDRIRFNGLYPVLMPPDDAEQIFNSPAAMEAAFRTAIKESLRRWMALAEERLDLSKVECYISPGNDDSAVVSECLAESKVIVNPDQRLTYVLGRFEMLSLGFSNPTPFHTPREISEAAFAMLIDKLAAAIREPRAAIFNIHCPPYNTGIDTAVELDRGRRVVSQHGQPIPCPIGSTAVRESIVRYQPLLGLHGHVHESRGVARLGRTLCINPGSRYNEGTLNGALVTLDERKGVASYQLVAA